MQEFRIFWRTHSSPTVMVVDFYETFPIRFYTSSKDLASFCIIDKQKREIVEERDSFGLFILLHDQKLPRRDLFHNLCADALTPVLGSSLTAIPADLDVLKIDGG